MNFVIAVFMLNVKSCMFKLFINFDRQRLCFELVFAVAGRPPDHPQRHLSRSAAEHACLLHLRRGHVAHAEPQRAGDGARGQQQTQDPAALLYRLSHRAGGDHRRLRDDTARHRPPQLLHRHTDESERAVPALLPVAAAQPRVVPLRVSLHQRAPIQARTMPPAH